MRRVMKSEVQPDKFIQPDGYDHCIDCWKRSFQRDDQDLGIKLRNTLKGDGDGYGDEDTSQSRRENEIANATNAMVHSLKSYHQWAIKFSAGVCRVWRYPQLDFIQVGVEARKELENKLRNNVALSTLF